MHDLSPNLPSAKLKEINEQWRRGVFINGLDPIFGYDTKGASKSYSKGSIRGTHFPCPENGVADSISVYIQPYNANYEGNAKCALYDQSAGSPYPLVSSTEERFISYVAGGQWETFNFPAPKPTLTNKNYWIVCWTANYTYYWWDSGVNGGQHWSTPYNSFPDPITFSSQTVKYSIYCSYTVAAPAGGVLAQIM